MKPQKAMAKGHCRETNQSLPSVEACASPPLATRLSMIMSERVCIALCTDNSQSLPSDSNNRQIFEFLNTEHEKKKITVGVCANLRHRQ